MKEILKLSFVLTLIAAVSAGVLAFVSEKTDIPRKLAQNAEKLAAVESVLPEFDNKPDEDTVKLADGEREVLFYRGRKGGKIVGVAFSVIAPNGYSGEIELMVGVDTSGVVTGVEVLKHLETPGLGARIETQEFREQFKGKSIDNPETWDVEKDGGIFKQITGATISSRAVTHAICRGLEFFERNKAKILSLESGSTDSTSAEDNKKVDTKSKCADKEE